MAVCLPAGVVAFAATLLPLAPIGQLGVGVFAALLWFGGIALVNPRVGEDVRILVTFLRRAFGRRVGPAS